MLKKNKPLDINSIRHSTNCGVIHYFDSIDSTNTWLLNNGKCGEICISEVQTSGRGRRGNTWESPQGNISISLCYCFDKVTEHWSLLGLLTGVAIAEALSDTGLEGHGVKWPNDIYWQQKKLGGILLETPDQSGKVIIGIGLNIAISSEIDIKINQSITSLSEAMPEKKDNPLLRETLITHLVTRIQNKLDSFKEFKFEQFITSWKTWDILQNMDVSFEHQGKQILGKVTEIDKQGRLGILGQDNKLSFYTSADIRLNKNGDTQ